MAPFAPTAVRAPVLAAVAAVLFVVPLFPSTGLAQILPWEIVVAQIETGRLRNFAERLAKQNLLFQLHLGETRKSDLPITERAEIGQ